MKLRFEINQAECFRTGIDAPKSIVTIEVDPKNLPQEERDLIAARLDGIDVRRLSNDHGDGTRHRITALLPDYESLIAAVRADEDMFQAESLEAIEAAALLEVKKDEVNRSVEPSPKEDWHAESAYRRGAHQAIAAAYRSLLAARERGVSVGQIIEEVGQLEDRVAKWRNDRSVAPPF